MTVILMVVTLIPLQASMSQVSAIVTEGNWMDEGNTNISWYTSNTEAITFSIGSAAELAGLAKLVNNSTVPVDFRGKTINLTADIDLAGKYWTPIGDNTEYNTAPDGWSGESYKLPFKGTFNGNNHKISNLSINPSKDGVGLFGYGNSAVLKDLYIENVSISSGNYSYVGSLVGLLESSEVNNVHVSGNINTSTSGNRVGGLVGKLSKSKISNSSVKASSGSISGSQEVGGLVGGTADLASIETSNTNVAITATGGQVGGLVGYAYSVDILKSYSIGSVYGDNNSIGGFIGEVSQGTVINSYSTGTVTLGTIHSDWSSVGGFVGINDGIISTSYSVGKVISEELNNEHKNEKIGGFVGKNSKTISSSYWNTTTSGYANSDAGTGLTTTQMKDQLNFTGFDFTSTTPVWSILSGTKISYPFFYNENTQSPAPGEETVTPITWLDFKDTSWAGEGSFSSPYIIASAEELAGLAYAVNVEGKYSLDNYTPTYFQLFATSTPIDQRIIDLEGRNWAPIGTSEHPFIALFNGNLSTIDHLSINTASTDNVGLFGVSGNTSSDRQNSVENLYLTHVDVSGKNYVGALVGHASNIKVRNVKAEGLVNGTEHVGGLIGRTDANASVNESYNTVQVSGFTGNVSGLSKVGGLIGSTLRTVPRFAYTEVQITIPNNASDVGGLVGRAEGGRITQTYTRGSITGGDGLSNIGQLVGYNSKEIKYNLSSLDLNLGINLINAEGLIGITDMLATSIQYNVVDNYAKSLTELKSTATQYVDLVFMITDDLSKLGANYVTYRASYNWFMKTNVDTPRLWFEIKNVSYPTPSWKGTGTLTQPYLIETAEQLQELSSFTNQGDGFEGKHFELSSNLDLSSIENWTPIGDATHPFNGILDGNQQTITGLNIPVQSNGAYINNAGLFGVTGPSAEISNLSLLDINVKGRMNVGGLVGLANGSDFSNIAVEGKVYGNSLKIGGIIGNFSSGTVDGNTGGNLLRSHFLGSIDTNGEVSNVGGLIGYNVRKIDMSYAEVTLNPGPYSTDIGGLVGYNKGGEIQDSYTIGDITSQGDTSNVGGLVGHHENTLSLGGIDSSYARMDITSKDGDANFGGLVGINAPIDNGVNLGKINQSFASGNMSGIATGKLIGLNNDTNNPSLSELISLTDLKKLSTFMAKEWSILLIKNHDGSDPQTNTSGTTSIWYLDEGTDTPRLWYQRVRQDSNNSSNTTGGLSTDETNTTSDYSFTVTNDTPTKIISKPIEKPSQDNLELVVNYGSTDLKGKIKIPELLNIKSLKVDLVNQLNALETTIKKKVVEQLDLEGKQLILDLQTQVKLLVTSKDDLSTTQNLSSEDLLAPITLNLPIPTDVKAEDVQVIHIQDDGSYKFVTAKIVTIDNVKYYSIETTQLGDYGLVTPLVALDELDKVDSGLGLIWYFVYGGILLLAGWFFWFILFKRRKKEEEEEA